MAYRMAFYITCLMVVRFLFSMGFCWAQDAEKYIDDLRYGVPKTRICAAEKLGEMRARAGIHALKEALNDEVEEVRCIAAEALGRIGARSALSLLKKNLSDEKGTHGARYYYAEALARLGDRTGLSFLKEGVVDKSLNFHRRAHIAEAMGILGNNAAVPALIQALKDESPNVCYYAVDALKQIGDKSCYTELCEMLKTEESAYVRVGVAKALGELDEKKAVTCLVMSLNDEDNAVRYNIRTALDKLVDKDKSCISLLLKLTKEEDEVIHNYVVETLNKLIDEFTIPMLVEASSSGDKAIRLYVISASARLKAKKGVHPYLVHAVDDPDPDIRKEVIFSLGEIGNKLALPIIEERVKDEDLEVRRYAVEALGKIKGTVQIKTLLEVLQTERWDIREAAAHSLGKLGYSSILDSLLKILRAEEWESRYFSAIALGELGSSGALSALEYTVTHDKESKVRESARAAIAKIQKKRIEEVP